MARPDGGRDAGLPAARAAADRGRPRAAPALRPQRPPRPAVLRRLRLRHRLHLAGRRSRFGDHVVSTSGAQRPLGIRGDRPPPSRGRADFGTRSVARLLRGRAAAGLARCAGRNRALVRPRSRRVRRHHPGRRQHSGTHADSRARPVPGGADGTGRGSVEAGRDRGAPRRSRARPVRSADAPAGEDPGGLRPTCPTSFRSTSRSARAGSG